MKRRSPWTRMLLPFLIAAGVQGKPAFQFMFANADTVALYEKWETQFDVSADFVNPFDPDEISMLATITGPSGREWKIPGFFGSGFMPWTVRFSPNETGRWTCRIHATDRKGSALSAPDTFFVIPSKRRGPVRISSANRRYMEYADGTPFYGVGLWYNGGFFTYPKGPSQTQELDRLKDMGVNFISAFLIPLETIGTGVGRYDQQLCARLDQLLEWCEERDFVLSLNLWFHSFLSETVWPGFNRRWNTNPYKNVCRAKDFFSSTKAWTYQEKLYRYIIARWAYSRALGIWFIVDEVNGTDGWASGDSLGAAKWGKKVHEYFKANDPYGHPTTGTRSGGVGEFWHEGYQTFDLAAREIYEAQGFPILTDGKIDPGDTHPLRLSYMNYAGEIRRLWRGYSKPVIIGETGWDHTFYEPSMPGYLALYHNALWTGLSAGMAMTPFWWSYSDYINDNVVTHQLANMAAFASQIPFSKLTGLAPVEVSVTNGDAFVMKSDQLTFGWVVNPESDVSGAAVKVLSLPDGDYTLRLYHTWGGRFFHQETCSCKNGIVAFSIPVLKIVDSRAQYVGQDVAFILKPSD